MGTRREGDVVKLTADKTWSDEALLKLLRSDGIEIIVGPMTPGRTRLGVRAPRGMNFKVTSLTQCQSTELYATSPA
ncbi:hypothetical protein D9M68_819750 [compost metagenome]